MKSLKNLNFEKIQNVGIRVDFNVPIDKNFWITDKTRLDRSKETIDFIKSKQCNMVLLVYFDHHNSESPLQVGRQLAIDKI